MDLMLPVVTGVVLLNLGRQVMDQQQGLVLLLLKLVEVITTLSRDQATLD